jgi:hypothetical protein
MKSHSQNASKPEKSCLKNVLSVTAPMIKTRKVPGLKDATKRMPGGDWKYKFVRNSSEMIASGDAYATKLYVKYKQETMTAFPKLTDDQIDQIFEYIDAVNR